jgi:hypothetical protein
VIVIVPGTLTSGIVSAVADTAQPRGSVVAVVSVQLPDQH